MRVKKYFYSAFLVIFIISSLSLQAQKKYKFKKLPKTLLTSWFLNYHVFYDIGSGYDSYAWENYNNVSLKITKDRVFIEEGDVHWDSYWGDFEEITSTYDFMDNYPEERTWENPTNEEEKTKENEFIIVNHLPISKTKGFLVLKNIDIVSDYEYYYLLSYDLTDENNAKIRMFYDLYNAKEAEYLAQNIGEIKQARNFVSQKLFTEYSSYPTMPAEDEMTYYQWWDNYLQTVEENKELLEDKYQYTQGINIFIGSYFAANLRHEIYLQNGYNPYESDKSLAESIKQFGFNEQIKQKIRGGIDQSAFEQTKQLLENTWFSDVYFAIGAPIRQIFTFKIQSNEIDIAVKGEMEGWAQDEYYQDMGDFQINLPILDIVPLMNADEGIIVIGPLPDSLRGYDDQGAYTVFGFKKRNNNELFFNLSGGIYETPEQAANASLRNAKWEVSPIFFSEEQYKTYENLASPPKMTFDEAVTLEEELNETYEKSFSNLAQDEYDYSPEMDTYIYSYLMTQYFVNLGYNPFEGAKQYYQIKALKEAEAELDLYKEDLEYYKSEKQTALEANNLEYANSLERSILNTEVEIKAAEIRIELIKAYYNKDDASIETYQKQLEQITKYYEIDAKLNNLSYSLSDVDYVIDDLNYYKEYAETELEYFDAEYYRNYLNDLRGNNQNFSEELKKVQEEIIKAEENKEILFADNLKKQIVLLEETHKLKGSPEDILQQAEELINELEEMQQNK